MDNLLEKTQGFQHGLIVFLSNFFCVKSSLGQTRRVSLAEMYLTSNVASEEPGLPIDLSNKQQWSRQGERYKTLQLSVLT